MSNREEQVKLTFGVEGLAARDELLLKSLIRLLAHRTHQQWSYGTGTVDLMMIGDEGGSLEQRTVTGPAQQVLYLGQNGSAQTPYLRLPVRSNELELMLNNLGAAIVQARSALAMPSTPLQIAENDELKLLKWPPAALVSTPLRLKMTTVLAGAHVSLAVLVERTGIDHQMCAAFVHDLLQAGLLECSAPAAAPAVDLPAATGMPPPQKRDIVSRIRARFGLKIPVSR